MAGLLLLSGLAVLLCIALTYKHRHQVKPRSITTEHGLYKDVLPPSRRQATGFKEVPRREILQSLVPLEGDVTHLHGTYTPTGISSNDIRRLGRFPDYAMLSGVRLPEPLPHVDINTACARPYRPVRWPYHQTMSISKMDPDHWIELEQNYRVRIQQRQELYIRHGKSVLDYLPGSELACRELMEMVLQFICNRYPNSFQLLNHKTTLRNTILNTETNLALLHPLHVLLNNIPEDFAITVRDPETGTYHFRAGIICSSLGWTLGSKLGKDIDAIHAPVPDYTSKMSFSMNRFFAKLPTDKPIQRGSWGIEIDQPIHMPPGDPAAQRHDIQDPDVPLDRYHLRVDWQTLRRLPFSAAVVFNFKVLFTPVTRLREEPYMPSLFLKNYGEAKAELMKHKNAWHTEATVVPALERWEEEQRENGVIPGDWEVATLREYPYYPGWETSTSIYSS
ncbi:hypothetical protein ASPSYDRAFT_156656 [Aspergillus sydowii CBS 593.65]|uniref:Uncharacterized protein n=1 Tax=Aspergillus sydowii CBS 593.65 TaxID=1036612 RepID=A0A1L9TAP7_9EURO|nr:uncharacterized protein ASPSYDRAFT_156656 [Aspergillus sydowii CBS 593.65]OJJ56494.1 hypothetical protein ASPSYDRAFT_156656 [Aspergillus sydowii CBS 593.65]